MEPTTSQTRVAGVNARWLAIFIGLLLLASTLVLLLLPGSPAATARGIVVLTTQFTNGKQVVTFRLTPPNSEVTFADVVPLAEDGNIQPRTIRAPGDYVLPVRGPGSPPSLKLRYLALPMPAASTDGRPVAYTPGSYIVACTPTAGVSRIRVGVACERRGFDDWHHRVQEFWRLHNVEFLLHKTHGDAVYMTSEPITNGTPRDKSSR